MKNKISSMIIKTVAAIIVIIVGGNMLAIISSENADDEPEKTAKIMPVFDDVNEENTEWIEYAYVRDIMDSETDNHFGTDEPVTISEAAYASVGIYEIQNHIKRSYDSYDKGDEKYADKAAEYGIWTITGKLPDDILTRAEAAAVLSPLAENIVTVKNYTSYIGMEQNIYAPQAIDLYNKGISLDKRISTAYSVDAPVTRSEFAKLVNMLESDDIRITEFMPDYAGMKAMLENMMNGYDGDWSLYFEDYEAGDVISINSHQVYSASLIKLFVMQTIYTKIDKGSLQESEHVKNLLYKMITVSDNDAWRELARLLGNGSYMSGMASVTETANESGFNDTGQYLKGDKKNFNFTSVNDCGAYMHKVLSGEIIAPEYSEKILNLLKQQQIKIKIPSGIPEGIIVANKTGELDYVQGDAAIVYAPAGTYILTIIADDLVNAGVAQAQIRELSAAVYNYLNN